MNAKVKLVCPNCDGELTCLVIDRQEHPNNWVLSDLSRKHLGDADCKSKKSLLITAAAS